MWSSIVSLGYKKRDTKPTIPTPLSRGRPSHYSNPNAGPTTFPAIRDRTQTKRIPHRTRKCQTKVDSNTKVPQTRWQTKVQSDTAVFSSPVGSEWFALGVP